MDSACYSFGMERLGDPLGSFPSVRVGSRPYNQWLTEAVLEPWLAARVDEGSCAAPAALAAEFQRASTLARRAFADSLAGTIAAGDAAVLAALGVTANLLRTLALLGEFSAAGGRLRAASPDEPVRFALSRFWCGLIEYPPGARHFSSRPQAPIRADAINYRRRESRHVASALGCSPAAVRRRCEEALDALGREIRSSGLFRPDDLRHFQSRPMLGPERSAG